MGKLKEWMDKIVPSDTCKDCGTGIPKGQKLKLCVKCGVKRLAEVTFRLNDGNVERHSLDRMGSLLKMAIGRRLTYANLIGCSK